MISATVTTTTTAMIAMRTIRILRLVRRDPPPKKYEWVRARAITIAGQRARRAAR
jgi:hypothetical protein